jgi:hypothetical protein
MPCYTPRSHLLVRRVVELGINMKRLFGLIAAVSSILLAGGSSASGQADPHTLSLGMKHGVFYPPLKWVPLRVDVRNNTNQPLVGHVHLPIDGEGASVTIRVPVHVPAHSRVTETAYAQFPEEVPLTAQQKRDKSVPPVTTGQLIAQDGNTVHRVDLLARPLEPSEARSISISRSPATTLLAADDFAEGPAFDADDFVRTIEQTGGYASTLATVDSSTLPRHRAAYDGVRVVLLGKMDPNALDAAQRETLLGFIRGGGVLVVSNPDPQVVGGSWLAQHLPVRLIGERLANQIAGEKAPIPLIGYVPMTEALAGDGEVLAADEHYVHAAVTPLGLGRIAFTSYPINGLKQDDSAAQALWARLLAVEAEPTDWSMTQLPAQRDGILSRMIGITVPPWGLAAGVTGGYLLLVVGAQLAIGGARRPKAFATTLVLAGVISVALVAMGFVRSSDQQPMGARLATLDLSPAGGGLIQENVAFVGQNKDEKDFSLKATNDDVLIGVAQTFTGGDKPVLAQQPFGVPGAGMQEASYQRVWRASSTLSPELKVSAVGRFDADGLTVRSNNQLGAPLQSPRVVWNDAVLPLGDALPAGDASRPAAATEGSLLVSGQDKLRQDILAALLERPALMTQATPTPPTLVGFVDEAVVPRLLETSAGPDLLLKTQALARVPLTIEPTPPGQTVRVPDRLVRMVTGRQNFGLPYDYGKREWLSTQQDGEFLVGFAAPWQMGVMRPERATITANLNAPRHRITLRPRSAPDQAVTWDNAVTTETASIDLSAGDVDENGVVWFTLSVERSGEIALGEVPTPWQIRSLRVGLEGDVVGAPKRPAVELSSAVDAEEDETPMPKKQSNTKKNNQKAEPRKQDPKKPDAKKAEPKKQAPKQPVEK